MTVTCAADPPDVTTSGGALAYTENDPATPIDPGLTVTDPDAGATITGATVAITANFAGAQDVLALSGVHPGISAGPQVGNTLTLTGTATPAAYQAALRDVTYRNTSEGPSTLARTVTFTVTDNTALSDSATRGITVAARQRPAERGRRHRHHRRGHAAHRLRAGRARERHRRGSGRHEDGGRAQRHRHADRRRCRRARR